MPHKQKLKSLNLSQMSRQKIGKRRRAISDLTIGFDKSKGTLRLKQKHHMDKRMKNRLRRMMAKENQGNIIGRPKKPPIIGSEKTDGKTI